MRFAMAVLSGLLVSMVILFMGRGSTWSLMMAGMYVALAWLTAEAMRNRRDQSTACASH